MNNTHSHKEKQAPHSQPTGNPCPARDTTFRTYPRINLVCQRSGLARPLRLYYTLRSLFADQTTPGYLTRKQINYATEITGLTEKTILSILTGTGNNIFWSLDREDLPNHPGKIKAIRIFTPATVAYRLEPYRQHYDLNLGVLISQWAKGTFSSPLSDLQSASKFTFHVIKTIIFAFTPELTETTLAEYHEKLEEIQLAAHGQALREVKRPHSDQKQANTLAQLRARKRIARWKKKYFYEFIYDGIQVSQKNLARLLGISRQTIAHYLNKLPDHLIERSEYSVIAEFQDEYTAQDALRAIQETSPKDHTGYYLVYRSNGSIQLQERESNQYTLPERYFSEYAFDIPGFTHPNMRKLERQFWNLIQNGLPDHITGSLTRHCHNDMQSGTPENKPLSLVYQASHYFNTINSLRLNTALQGPG